MSNDNPLIPPTRELDAERLAERRRHLLAEIRDGHRRPRSRLVFAVVALLAVTAAILAAVEATTARGTGSTPQVPSNLLNSHVSAAGYAGNEVWALTANGLSLSAATGAWNDVTPASVQLNSIHDASFVDTKTGWLAVYGQTQSDGTPLLVYRTTDGGASWQAVKVDESTLLTASEQNRSWLTFTNARDGWLEVQTLSGAAFSNANLYRTSDGGLTWSPEQIPIAGSLTFTSPTDGFVTGGAAGTDMYATHDGGSNWKPVNLPGPSGEIFGPVFATPTNGLVSVTVSSGAVYIYQTTDGGSTWTLSGTLAASADQASSPTPVAIVDGGWLAVQGPGAKLVQMQSGQTAASPLTPVGLPTNAHGNVSTLDFPSGSNTGLATFSGGICTGLKSNCSEFTAVYSTSDGGTTWTQLTP